MSETLYRSRRLKAIHRAIGRPRTRTDVIDTAEALAMVLATVAGAINEVGQTNRAIEEPDWPVTDAQRVLDLLEVPNA
jgi:hypothetical protein